MVSDKKSLPPGNGSLVKTKAKLDFCRICRQSVGGHLRRNKRKGIVGSKENLENSMYDKLYLAEIQSWGQSKKLWIKINI